MKIICSRKIIRKFREECKKLSPIEHVAALFGSRSSDGDLIITRIEPLRYEATEDDVTVQDRDMRRSKLSALRKESEWLGTIHSHCWTKEVDCCWHLSGADIESALEFGESICGIVYVFDEGKKSSVHWYVPHPIPKVKYL